MKIEVLGTGCARCDITEKVVREAVKECGVDAEVSKVSDRKEIAKFGVWSTPAVVIDGKIKLTGKIPEKDEVIRWLKE